MLLPDPLLAVQRHQDSGTLLLYYTYMPFSLDSKEVCHSLLSNLGGKLKAKGRIISKRLLHSYQHLSNVEIPDEPVSSFIILTEVFLVVL